LNDPKNAEKRKKESWGFGEGVCTIVEEFVAGVVYGLRGEWV